MRSPPPSSQAGTDLPISDVWPDFGEATIPQPLRALSDGLEGEETQPDFLEFDVPDATAPMPMESMFPTPDTGHLTLLRDWPHAVLALEMGR